MIKLFLVDIDGTLTDGIYHTTENGKISKDFFTRDFHGLWMLNQTGVKICIITAANDDVIDHQCRRGAKYVHIVKGSKDKFVSIEDKYVTSGPRFQWDEIAYIADDVFDMTLLEAVGVCACPSDADREVLNFIKDWDGDSHGHGESFCCSFPGGHGCVREFAEYILKINEAAQ